MLKVEAARGDVSGAGSMFYPKAEPPLKAASKPNSAILGQERKGAISARNSKLKWLSKPCVNSFEMAAIFELHPNQITERKKQRLGGTGFGIEGSKVPEGSSAG